MKVKAKHWIKYNGQWYHGGDEFEIPTTESEELKNHVEIAETPVIFGKEQNSEDSDSEEVPKRRGRPSKKSED